MKNIGGLHYATNRPIQIDMDGGIISKVRVMENSKSDDVIAPGLVDLQINGFNGIDFNEGGLDEKKIVAITGSLWQEGVTTYFPTLITNSDDNISASIKSIVKACNNNEFINNSIGGIHLEGPFLSKQDGPRGAHPIKYIKAPDLELFYNWQAESEGRIKIVTISPEWPGSVEFIEKCVATGVMVAIGHTSAGPEQIKKAIKAGASMSTHLGNGTHSMLPRHPNYIWEQLSSEHLWSTIIADGFHLPEAVLRVFLKVKPEKSVLVSDSTKFAGLPPGSYTSHIGGEVELDMDGKLFMKDNPTMLAGSAQSLLWCINHLVDAGIATLGSAIEMASVKPMELLKNSAYNGLKKDKRADLIILERSKNKIKIKQTIKSGEVVYSK